MKEYDIKEEFKIWAGDDVPSDEISVGYSAFKAGAELYRNDLLLLQEANHRLMDANSNIGDVMVGNNVLERRMKADLVKAGDVIRYCFGILRDSYDPKHTNPQMFVMLKKAADRAREWVKENK